jgi:hypothetical protein
MGDADFFAVVRDCPQADPLRHRALRHFGQSMCARAPAATAEGSLLPAMALESDRRNPT